MEDWARLILEGNTRALARAATGIENRDPRALAVLREVAPRAGKAIMLGITGPPGAGKSSLVDALARELRSRTHRIGIVAVDPSSRATGGAILGDRIRMLGHHSDPGIFIRSMATRGSLGGLARATANVARLLDAAGMDFVIIETVGVGQDEIEIANVAQITILVLVPGAGDDVQAIKAGIMEIADIYVINKSDLPGADRLEREVQGLLGLGSRQDGWVPPIIKTVATEERGIQELLDAVNRFRESGLSGQRKHGRDSEFAIDHVAIAVHSIDRVIGFYRDQLGLPVESREAGETEGVRQVSFRVGASEIKLVESAVPNPAITGFLEKGGKGLHRLSIRVPDLRAIVASLRAAGSQLLEESSPSDEAAMRVYVHPASTGGVLLELIQDQENSI